MIIGQSIQPCRWCGILLAGGWGRGEEVVVPDDGGGAVGCFDHGEAHSRKKLAHATGGEPGLLGPGAIERLGDALDRKDGILDRSSEGQDGGVNLTLQGCEFGMGTGRAFCLYLLYHLPEDLLGLGFLGHLLPKLDGFEGIADFDLAGVLG